MNKSIFTYLRTSAALRLFSALALIILTGSTVIASDCSSCSMKSSVSNNSRTCSMPQADMSAEANKASCCCSKPATIKTVAKKESVQNKSKGSCCSTKTEQPDSKSQPLEIENQAISGIENNFLAQASQAKTASEESTCQHSGSCAGQFQGNTNLAIPPPLKSIEQEKQDIIVLMTLAQSESLSMNHLPSLSSAPPILHSGGPPLLSGIGSLQLIC